LQNQDNEEKVESYHYPKDEAPSKIESIMSGRFPTDISQELEQFGYDFFEKDIPIFTPIENIPVGSDYIIGPGDSFTINIWGKAEAVYNVTVTRDGSITLPRVGTLNISGLDFEELKKYIYNKLKKYYPDFEMSLTMGTLRTITVFIVGEVKKPGTYSVSALSTVLTALYQAGGPTKNGSLKEIRLLRNGETVATLDLYNFFIHGLKKNDLRLLPGDTIFVPVIGPVVGITGTVKRPAIYEFNTPHTIGDVINLSGGVLPVSYLQNIVVERIREHQRRVVKSFNLDPTNINGAMDLQTPIQDGDIIKIYPIYKELRQVVFLEGHVKYPREYELKEGLRLLDIIPSYDFLLPEPYLEAAEIIRLIPPDLHPEIIEFDLGALLSGDDSYNFILEDQDRIIIYDKWDKRDKPEVVIKGAVRAPGTYQLYEGMTIKDLLFQAGNLTDKAYLDNASLTRIVTLKDGTETLLLEFSPKNAVKGVADDNLQLKNNDVINIREIPEFGEALNRKITLEGEFLFPGEYTFSRGERLSSVIERAGGLTGEAYPFGAIFTRESVRMIQEKRLAEYISQLERNIIAASATATRKAMDEDEAAVFAQTLSAQKELLAKLKSSKPTGRMVINMDAVLLVPSSELNLEVRPGDRLMVMKRPDSINILGEVYNPTALFAEKEKTVDYYLDLVGGPTKQANEKELYIVKANGSVISRSQAGLFGLANWDNTNNRWAFGKFGSIHLDPGDTIIVPRKIQTYPWMKIFKDTSQILYNIAIAAAVVYNYLE
jgi:protein involved in polysaccharide export with SLBB domain